MQVDDPYLENDTFIAKKMEQGQGVYNELVSSFTKPFADKLIELLLEMGRDHVNMTHIDSILDVLEEYIEGSERHYMMSVLFPEMMGPCRIPSKFPLNTCTFALDTSFRLQPNTGGNILIQWCPQTLFEKSFVSTVGCLSYNNDITLDGKTANNPATNYQILRNADLQASDMIQAYRLVSASIILIHHASIQETKGTLGGGVDVSFYDSTVPDTEASDFSNIMDKMYASSVKSYEGLRLIYCPKDSGDLNYIKINKTTNENNIATCFRMFAYAQGIPPTTEVELLLTRNFEAIPKSNASDYFNMEPIKRKNYVEEPAPRIASGIMNSNKVVRTLGEDKEIYDFVDNGNNIDDFDTKKASDDMLPGNLMDAASYNKGQPLSTYVPGMSSVQANPNTYNPFNVYFNKYK